MEWVFTSGQVLQRSFTYITWLSPCRLDQPHPHCTAFPMGLPSAPFWWPSNTLLFVCTVFSSSKTWKYCEINTSVHQHSSYMSHTKEVVAGPGAWCEGIWDVWECRTCQEHPITKFVEILPIFPTMRGLQSEPSPNHSWVLSDGELLSILQKEDFISFHSVQFLNMDGQNDYIAAVRRNKSIWDSIPVKHLQSGPCYWPFTSTHMSVFGSYLNKKLSSI